MSFGFWTKAAGSRPDSLVTRFAWTPLPFDTSVFGMPMARLDGVWGDDEALVQEFPKWLAERDAEGLRHLAARIPSGLPQPIRFLEAHDFRYVDALITFEWKRRNYREVEGVEVAQASDAEAVGALSVAAFNLNRFTSDPNLAREGVDLMHRTWAMNNLNGRADRNWVVRKGARLAGFIQCLDRPSEDCARIDLIAVDADFRGQGIGESLVETFVAHYSPLRARLLVGTQGANRGAMRLYERCGFLGDDLDLTLHRTPANGMSPG